MNLHLNCCTADQLSAAERQRILQLADAHRRADPAFAHWAAGYGVIRHDPLTQLRIRQTVHELVALGRTPDAGTAWQRFAAADRVTSAGMWPQQAKALAETGATSLADDPATAAILLVATGAYQLQEVRRAQARLVERGVSAAIVYLGEPGRFRAPRDAEEARYVHSDSAVQALFPVDRPRVFVTHTRPEPFLRALRRLDTGPGHDRSARLRQPRRHAGRARTAVCQPQHLGARGRCGCKRPRPDPWQPVDRGGADGSGWPRRSGHHFAPGNGPGIVSRPVRAAR
jgi:hypothetical protein